ncbi:MAG: UbiH/UbiF/VisC/COQ6 family ubiquinone biosynthesis hydroxylase [Gammaproteobacteria bacterium]|nr:UbiH/UbiF/VisC/COQ6 family ubiquinone biosynthesis hydroxylase [Gammaproteobacteria bacterium]MBT8076716.1 UbiH/UbiF/VisC/COQ6 family ubiquinone biosynthesis hydroxylase [Gammaproteobacteria bacterium]NNK98281.1 UbiH/UbiF/VisC/COQ6 family ubiquinone biosynthesis hydroxylase [Xanthomonadales bacterium]
MSNTHYDVAVIGAGMVGATLASLLSRSGFSVALVESREPEAFDAGAEVGLRVSAISPGSQAILEQAGAWKAISSQRARPYRRMQVEDGVDMDPLLFDAPVFNLERLGTIVENALVQWSLWQVLNAGGLVDLYCPDQLAGIEASKQHNRVLLQGGKTLTASLVVGADGAASRVRKSLGIRQDHYAYNQSGLVAAVGKSQANPGVAWQRFLPGGPLAFLPLSDGRSSIVWTQPTAEAERLLQLDSEEFGKELDVASSGWLGAVESCGPRAAFPLSMRLSENYAARRVVLIGDAAHVVHPLAGQGVNLGFADAAGLTEILLGVRSSGEDIGSSRVLRKYERWRKSESEAMAFGMHALRSLFGIDGLSPARRFGMAMVKRSWLLRDKFLQRAAGLAANAPALAKGETLRSLIQR